MTDKNMQEFINDMFGDDLASLAKEADAFVAGKRLAENLGEQFIKALEDSNTNGVSKGFTAGFERGIKKALKDAKSRLDKMGIGIAVVNGKERDNLTDQEVLEKLRQSTPMGLDKALN